MRYCAFIVTIAAIAAAEVQQSGKQKLHDIEDIRAECMQISKVNEDQLAKGSYESDPKMKNLMKCVSMKLGLIDEEGNIHLEKYRQIWGGQVDDEIIEKIIKNCAEKKAKIEDTVLHFNKCAQEYRALGSK